MAKHTMSTPLEMAREQASETLRTLEGAVGVIIDLKAQLYEANKKVDDTIARAIAEENVANREMELMAREIASLKKAPKTVWNVIFHVGMESSYPILFKTQEAALKFAKEKSETQGIKLLDITGIEVVELIING